LCYAEKYIHDKRKKAQKNLFPHTLESKHDTHERAQLLALRFCWLSIYVRNQSGSRLAAYTLIEIIPTGLQQLARLQLISLRCTSSVSFDRSRKMFHAAPESAKITRPETQTQFTLEVSCLFQNYFEHYF
jgi:hypothetical protein